MVYISCSCRRWTRTWFHSRAENTKWYILVYVCWLFFVSYFFQTLRGNKENPRKNKSNRRFKFSNFFSVYIVFIKFIINLSYFCISYFYYIILYTHLYYNTICFFNFHCDCIQIGMYRVIFINEALPQRETENIHLLYYLS